VEEGEEGYEAVMECRSVQEELPSCSTSGGQSFGGRRGVWEVEVERDFVTEEKSEKEVQERQLCAVSKYTIWEVYGAYGLPSFPSTTFGFLTPGNASGAATTASFFSVTRVSSAMFYESSSSFDVEQRTGEGSVVVDVLYNSGLARRCIAAALAGIGPPASLRHPAF
jgi:hypothetical protein